MQSSQNDHSWIERLTLLAIVLFVAAIGIQSLLHSFKESEEHTLNAAVVEYSTVRRMYAEPYHARYSGVATTSPQGHRADILVQEK